MKKGQIGIFLGIMFLILVAVLTFSVFSYLLKAAFIPIKTVTNQIDSASDIVDKTYTADNAIYNYEWFKIQYEKIQANRNQVKITIIQIEDFKTTYGVNVKDWDYETKQEYNRLNTIKLGLQNQDENLMAEYNARSKMANRAIFKDKLPFFVDRVLW